MSECCDPGVTRLELSRLERLVVMLLYAEELTIVEAAAVLDLAPRTVRRIEAAVRSKVEGRIEKDQDG